MLKSEYRISSVAKIHFIISKNWNIASTIWIDYNFQIKKNINWGNTVVVLQYECLVKQWVANSRPSFLQILYSSN